MKGLVIWAQIKCRSVMALYREMAKALEVPLLVPIWHEVPMRKEDIRKEAGFRKDEFAGIESIAVGDDFQKGVEILEAHRDWNHLFCVYQAAPVFRRLIAEAKKRCGKVGVMSEAPCNMDNGLRGLAKEVYLRFVLKRRLHDATDNADFYVNYSGNDAKYLQAIGWDLTKVISFGYFPPPIEGSQFAERNPASNDFLILSSGIMTWHRGVDVLVEALRLLLDRRIPYRAVITQKGPLLKSVREKAQRLGLPIEFPGFVAMPELIRLYETCSVYVGAGRHEPWGMRLNDALNCGAPLVVSTGMGGVKMVDDYACGASFAAGDAQGLADALEKMIVDRGHYARVLANTREAAAQVAPEVQARLLVQAIEKKCPGWLGKD